MADLHKFTTKEVLNKVLLDSSGNSVAAFSHTSQEALNAVLDSANSRLNVSLVGGTISGDVTISGDLTVEGSNTNATYDEIIQGALQITASSAFIDVTDTDSNLNVKIQSGDSIGAIGTSTNHPLSIRTNNTERMHIDTSGNVDFKINDGGSIDIIPASGITGTFNLKNSGGTILLGLHTALSTLSGFSNNSALYSSGALQIFSQGDNPLALGTNATTRLHITGDGNIGIGTTSPLDYGTSATNLVIKEDGSAGLSIITGTSNTGNIHFGDGTSSSSAERKGLIRYDHSTDNFIFWTNGSEKLVMSSSGHLVPGSDGTQDIGTTNSKDWGTLFIRKIDMANNLLIIDSTGTTARFSDHVSVGDGILFFHRGAEAMRIGVEDDAALTTTISGDVQITSSSISSMIRTSTETNSVRGSLHLKHTTTGNMVDGFGSSLNFQIRDSAGVDNSIAQIHGVRDGADNQGALTFSTNGVGGTLTERMRIDVTGDVGIGVTPRNVGSNVTLDTKNIYIGVNGALHGSINSDDGIYMNFDANNSNTNSSFNVGTNGSGTGGTTLFKIDDNSRISLSNNDSGDDNTILGYQAGNNVTGDRNTFLGDLAGHTNTSGDDNTYIGTSAGQANSGTGDDNTFVGSFSGYQLTGGSSNTAVGQGSLQNITSGTNNTIVGRQAGDAINQGQDNSLFGMQSGTSLQLGRYNSALGYQSLNSEQHGSYSTALGYKAMYAQVHGSVNGDTGNVGVGYSAGFYNVTGTNNTYIGSQSGYGASSQSNSNNTAVGYFSLYAITTGGQNTAIGSNALLDITSGSGSTAVGHDALENTTAAECVGVGKGAGQTNTSGINNTFVGTDADSSGNFNYQTALGWNATTDGSYAVAVGMNGIKKFKTARITLSSFSSGNNTSGKIYSNGALFTVPAYSFIKRVVVKIVTLSSNADSLLAIGSSATLDSAIGDSISSPTYYIRHSSLGTGYSSRSQASTGADVSLNVGDNANANSVVGMTFIGAIDDNNAGGWLSAEHAFYVVHAGSNTNSDPTTDPVIDVLVEYY